MKWRRGERRNGQMKGQANSIVAAKYKFPVGLACNGGDKKRGMGG